MPKNIILLADGTGNSAASALKTNVWRLYQALDLRTPAPAGQASQIAYYDDGVGTESFKPLKVLGLAFGFGLARNVRDLYTFLCRNYEEGDGIFLFGFSRGAFTVRVLAGLILRCGLVRAPSETELEERVKAAYSEYKRDVARRATVTRPYLIAGRLLGGHETGYGTDHVKLSFEPGFEQLFPEISFMGIWDTVDAYGMPIDELKLAIDHYVWPMTLADRNLSTHIERVCHALSLDDERPTFRPVLWTEDAANQMRLTQMWFAGVHANVGGGYPDDGLAHVAMQWMMDESSAKGLHFHALDRQAIRNRIDPHGEEYDARAGLAGYYRYGPRFVEDLCNDPTHGVAVAMPKVHESVQGRIHGWQVAYAPVGFPSNYEIYGGWPLAQVARLETRDQAIQRASDVEDILDAVLRRKVAYFGTVVLSAVLVLFPALHWLGWLPPSFPFWSWFAGKLTSGLHWLFTLAPSWAAPWTDSFAEHPAVFLIAAAILAWLFFRKSAQLENQIFERAEYAWRRV
jgi:uncharacterized protein (DUF2235 family)